MFIRTVGEYTMSALLYGVHNRPVSISIITNMQEYHIGISLAYGVLVIAGGNLHFMAHKKRKGKDIYVSDRF